MAASAMSWDSANPLNDGKMNLSGRTDLPPGSALSEKGSKRSMWHKPNTYSAVMFSGGNGSSIGRVSAGESDGGDEQPGRCFTA